MDPVVVERDVAASPEDLWAVVVDVESWPRWTASMTSVELLDPELAVGARASVAQPRLPKQVWTVTELDPGRTFTWTVRAPGIVSEGRHDVHPVGDGRSRIVLTLDMSGPLAPVAGVLLGGTTRRYVGLEADGLAAAAEARAGSPGG